MLKRSLCVLLALCLLTAPALADSGSAGNYPALPITLEEYTSVHTDNMTRYIDPNYSEYGVWQLIEQEDGTVVVTDGINQKGVYYVTLKVQGAHVKSITVSYPYLSDDPQQTTEMLQSWAVMSLAPVLMHDGVDFWDALVQADAEFVAWTRDMALPVCGMEASMNRTTGENSAVSVTFTFRQPRAELPLPAGEDLTQVSAEGYMRALDDYALSVLDQNLIWTKPEEWLGCTLYAVDSLRDVPTLMVQDDKLVTLMVSMPLYEGQPQLSFDTAAALTRLSLVPLLTAGGMTEDEAIAAVSLWEEEVHFPALLTSGLSGVKCETEFYGFQVIIDGGESLNIHLLTDAYWDLEYDPDELLQEGSAMTHREEVPQ